MSVSARDRNRWAITDEDVMALATWGMMIEEYYEKPQDIEWAKDGDRQTFYRPGATRDSQARSNHAVIEKYELKKKGEAIATGIAIGQKIGAGKVRVIDDPRDMKLFKRRSAGDAHH